jgi:hypothetical protein
MTKGKNNMKSRRFLDRRLGFSLSSIGLLLGIVAPAAMPAFASADVITSRSITMSSSATGASDTIEVKGTLSSTGALPASGGVVVLFCSDSPLIGATCTAPTAMTVTAPSGSGSTNPGTATKISDNAIKFAFTSSLANSATFDFKVSGIANPSTVGTFYARIATYSDTNLTGATADDSTGVIDTGAVALSTTDNIGVTAYVLESMTFCVSGDSTGVLSGDCGTDDPDGGGAGTASGVSSPSMTLGETTGSVTALQTNAVSHKDVNTQISTNAVSGAIVNLKSDATSCGGLYRASTSNCNIAPQTSGAGTITAGDAMFGLKVSDPADAAGAGSASGGGTISKDGSYSNSNYFLDYVAGNATGVTSTYGSSLFHSTGPVNNQNVGLTFGASIANTTPAGVYGANMSLIATGRF